jgi:hypothetical protein
MGLMRLHTLGSRQRKTRWSLPSGAVKHAYSSEPIFVAERLKPRENADLN